MADVTTALIGQVNAALANASPLAIRGAGTHDGYGYPVTGELLDTTAHHGIISYEPAELVMRVRAGTRLSEVEAALAEAGQMLPFEPPRLNGGDPTIGGVVAAGLSGPSRPFLGAVRDMVLGTTVLDGHGRVVSFGGQVMKNVAGYDVSRLMTGSWGTLGVLLDVSLRLLPKPPEDVSFRVALPATDFPQRTRDLLAKVPVTGAVWEAGQAIVRVAGSASIAEVARREIGGDAVAPDELDRYRDLAFVGQQPAWRESCAATTAVNDDAAVLDWGGAQRFYLGAAPVASEGHVTLINASDDEPRFPPMSAPVKRINQRLKQAFDPNGIFNPNRLERGE